MNLPSKFIRSLPATLGLLLALPPAVSKAADDNTRNGKYALEHNTTGFDNVADGYEALRMNITGYQNVASGFDALYDNTDGYENVASGQYSLYNNSSGNQNVANGYKSLYNNTEGFYNVANGYKALFANTNGIENTADGYQTLYNCTTDSQETATGYQALYNDTTGGVDGSPSDNVADGFQALFNCKSGMENVAAGCQALYKCTSDGQNTATGYQALYNDTIADAVEFGLPNGNVANGFQALFENTGGYYNAAVGFQALFENQTGDGNVAIGVYAGYNITGNNNIDIADFDPGAGFADDLPSDSGVIRIGDESTQTATYIAGISGKTVGSDAQIVVVDSTGKLGTVVSAPTSSIDTCNMRNAIAKLESTVEDQAKELASQKQINAQQQRAIATLTASLKEQASLLQKVSAEVELSRSAPRIVSNIPGA
jgi:hypothetical protein